MGRATARCAALCILIGLLVGSSGCRDEQSPVGADLISAFQGGCTGAGSWTQTALAHNQKLHEVISKIAANDACKAVGSSLQDIQGLSTKIQSVLQSDEYAKVRAAEEKLQDLTLALQGVDPSSELAEVLSRAIIEAQVDLAEKKAANSASEKIKEKDRVAHAAFELATYASSLTGKANDLSTCLESSPSAAVQLATNLIAMGGSFISPIFGATTAAIGTLINTGVEAARTAGPTDALWELYSAQMPTALTCGMEAMTEFYCDANDAFDLVQLGASQYSEPGAPAAPFWQGVDLIGRRMPVLNSWLLMVKNGGPPTDAYDAEKQSAVWRKVFAVEEYDRTLRADFNDASMRYDAAA